ncbi:MAG: ribosome maturation factor RimM [Alphaproteobacteria bacterium]|jgi:16S rRNA processing protein RimM|nr:ribosome maturation factor RimM [Alphaproteobacteria bacterium]MDP6567551.1 ribosome maturation factor RimM [Alphaproteobacteria bacterium]MDP6812765.1 ribosome maturation factor RimM [Alphaproteobacteria bacterium]
MAGDRLLLGEIVAAHGIKGLVKVRTHTAAPGDLVAYGPLRDEAGRSVELSLRGPVKGGVLAAIAGVDDRDQAEAFRGIKLYVERSALPALDQEEEAFYHADLIGLAVELPDGTPFAEVTAVHDFGAGDLLELRPLSGRKTVLVPFDAETVPEIDVASRRIVIAPPEGLLD